WRVFLTGGIVLAALGTLIAGWWLVRNQLLYGDVTALSSMWAVWGVRERLTWDTFWAELPHFRTTFWANIGYGNVPAPGWVYTLLDVFVVCGLTGLLVAVIRGRKYKPFDRVRRNQTFVLLSWAILTLVSLFWY